MPRFNRFPARFLVAALLAACGLAPAGAAEIAWVQSYADGVRQARSTGQPLMVNFYADW
ncbi:MAG: hypothetical protein HY722_07855 [Planctomycetes bacterium]|nr:hypothetical protein [Planctomycetota bacterium]